MNLIMRSFILMIASLGSFALLSCSSVSKSPDKKDLPAVEEKERSPQPPTTPSSSSSVSTPGAGTTEGTTPPAEPPPMDAVQSETVPVNMDQVQFKSVIAKTEDLKVGVILGPGAMKSYAHIGILRELNENKIPIHSIVGLEWGSLVGALYSITGSIFEVEWKLFKLREGDLPRQGILAPQIKAESIDKLNSFLDEVLGGVKLNETKIPFSCPAARVAHGEIRWSQPGSLKDEVKKCMAFPPYFLPQEGYTAAAFSLREAAEKMRNEGMDLIIFINVVDQGPVISEDKLGDEYVTQLLWKEGRDNLKRQEVFVDKVIVVFLKDSILSYNSRKEIMSEGQESSKTAIKKLVEKYGF